MAVTIAGFRTTFREFADDTATLDADVQAKLDEAERANDEGHFGAMYDDACYYYAAHLLMSSPYGMGTGLASDKDEHSTTYLEAYRMLLYRGKRRTTVSGGLGSGN